MGGDKRIAWTRTGGKRLKRTNRWGMSIRHEQWGMNEMHEKTQSCHEHTDGNREVHI